MLSKNQADAAAQALLESGRHERDKRSPLLARYPELKGISFAQRQEILRQAQNAVWRKWYIVLIAAAILVAALFWVAGLFQRMEPAESAGLVPLLGVIFLHSLVQRQTRRELRRILAR